MELFGIDVFEKVVNSLSRVASIFCALEKKPSIIFQGRGKDDFEIDQKLKGTIKLFGEYSKENWISEYKDWGGTIWADSIPVQRDNKSKQKLVPCERALVPVIFCDGKVGLCACADYDQKMVIGDLMNEELETIIVSEKRQKLIRSFSEGCIPEFCARCTFYEPYMESLEDWTSAFADA